MIRIASHGTYKNISVTMTSTHITTLNSYKRYKNLKKKLKRLFLFCTA